MDRRTVHRPGGTGIPDRSNIMQVRIIETNQVESLSIIDLATGCDYVADYIGNMGAFSDGQFSRADDDVMECSQDTYNWWADQIARQSAVDQRIADLAEEHGSDRVYKTLADVGSVDFGDQPEAIQQALDDEFGAA
jgi:hypothetical protein